MRLSTYSFSVFGFSIHTCFAFSLFSLVINSPFPLATDTVQGLTPALIHPHLLWSPLCSISGSLPIAYKHPQVSLTLKIIIFSLTWVFLFPFIFSQSFCWRIVIVINYSLLTQSSVQFSSVAQLCPTFATPWTTACRASLPITNSQSPPKPMSIESVMPSNHLIFCCPLLLLPSIFPSIRVFSNESALRIRWPKYWSFSFKISPTNEHPGLISFRMDWLDLLAIQGTCKSLLQLDTSTVSNPASLLITLL